MTRSKIKDFFYYFLFFLTFFPFLLLIASGLIFLTHFVSGLPVNVFVFILEYFFWFLFLFFLLYRAEIIEKNIFINLFLLLIFSFQFFVFYLSFNNATFPHHVHDASNHVFFIKRIQQTKTLKPSLIFDIPEINQSQFYLQPAKKTEPWYPFGFHTGVLFICQLIRQECIKIPWIIAWFYASSVGIAIFFLTREFFKKEIAILSSIFTTIFYLFPYMPFGWGGWAQVAGQILIIFSLIFIIRYFRNFNRDNGFLAVISSVSLFYIHTTDFLTLLVIFFLFITSEIFSFKYKKIKDLIKRRFKKILITIFISSVAILPGFITGYKTKISTPLSFFEENYYLIEKPLFGRIDFLLNTIKNFYLYHLVWINKNEVSFLFFLIGFLLLIINKDLQKKGRFFIILVLFLSLFVFLLRFSPSVFNRLSFFFPWNQFERIMYSFSLFYPTISAIGLYSFWQKIKSISFKMIFIFIFSFFYFRTLFYTDYYINLLNKILNPVTKNDILMFEYIKSSPVFKKKLFFTDSLNSAGAWLNKISPVNVFFPMTSTDFISKDGWYFLSIFSDEKINPKKTCQRLINKKTDYIFISERVIVDKKSIFDLNKVNRLDCLKLIKKYGKSLLYQVNK